jgi:hypothetical protein
VKEILQDCYNTREPQPVEAVKKSPMRVIPSAARNLHLFVFKEINADASLRACDFFGFLAVRGHLTLLLSVPLFS